MAEGRRPNSEGRPKAEFGGSGAAFSGGWTHYTGRPLATAYRPRPAGHWLLAVCNWLSRPRSSALPRAGLKLQNSKFKFLNAVLLLFLPLAGVRAELTNAAVPLLSSPALPNAGPSLLRVLGALAMVLGLFLGGAWLFRNGRTLAFRRGRAPRLSVLESRSLGGRHAIYVVAYEQERFLLGSTPAGINLLSHLPALAEEETVSQEQATAIPFAQALSQVLKGNVSGGSKR